MNLKSIRLEAVGHISESEQLEEGKSVPDKLEKDALLVYSGQFESMDGPVEITDDHIEMLAGNHNSILGKMKRLATGEIPMKAYPPIQLDHSTSATMTVGRLVGELTVGEHDVDGKICKALMGKVRVLGSENVAKVMDGRWTHLSIGADLDSGKINELTITPFPAAANASLLKKKTELAGFPVRKAHKGVTYVIDETEDGEFEIVSIGGIGVGAGPYKDYRQAEKEAKETIEDELKANMSKKAKLFGNTTLDRQTFDLEGYPCAMNNEDGNFWAECSGQRVPGNFKTEASAKKNLKDFINEFMSKRESEKELSRMSAGYKVGEGEKDGFGYLVLLTPDGYIGTLKDDMNSFTEIKRTPEEAIDMVDVLTQNKKAQMAEIPKENEMNKEKLKKYLMDKEELSAEDAESKLAGMPDDKKEELSAEIEENEKKIAAEEEEKSKLEAEKDKEDKELAEGEDKEEDKLSQDPPDQDPKNDDLSPDKTKMSNAKTAFIKLAKDMRKTSSDINLAAKKNRIHARLNALRSKGKISPAEIKKVDLSKLASSEDKVIDSVLSTYESREPVLHIGVYGTAKAVNLAKIASDQKMAALELESRLNMSMKKAGAKELLEQQKSVMKRFSSEHALESPEKTEIHIDTTPHTHYEVLAKMLDEGKDKEEIKSVMRRLYDESANKEGGQLSEIAETSEAEMSTLAENVKRLQTQFKELTEIVGPALGIKSKELHE